MTGLKVSQLKATVPLILSHVVQREIMSLKLYLVQIYNGSTEMNIIGAHTV